MTSPLLGGREHQRLTGQPKRHQHDECHHRHRSTGERNAPPHLRRPGRRLALLDASLPNHLRQRQRHADRKGVEVIEQPGPAAEHGELRCIQRHDPGAEHDGDEHHGGQADPLVTHPSGLLGRWPGHAPGKQRQKHAERCACGQRPGQGDGPKERVRGIDVGERQVGGQVERGHRLGLPIDERGDQQHHPVGREESERQPPKRAARRGPGGVRRDGPGKWQIQQVPGHDEQHGDANIEPGGHRTEREPMTIGRGRHRPQRHGGDGTQRQHGKRRAATGAGGRWGARWHWRVPGRHGG